MSRRDVAGDAVGRGDKVWGLHQKLRFWLLVGYEGDFLGGDESAVFQLAKDDVLNVQLVCPCNHVLVYNSI